MTDGAGRYVTFQGEQIENLPVSLGADDGGKEAAYHT